MDHVRDRKEFQKCDARAVLQCFSHLKGDVGNGNSIKGGRHQSFLGLDWIDGKGWRLQSTRNIVPGTI